MKRILLVAGLAAGLCSSAQAREQTPVPLPTPRPPIAQAFIKLESSDRLLPVTMPESACAGVMKAFEATHPDRKAVGCSVSASVANGKALVGFVVIHQPR
jgi:opacity protein-like surface antigen